VVEVAIERQIASTIEDDVVADDDFGFGRDRLGSTAIKRIGTAAGSNCGSNTSFGAGTEVILAERSASAGAAASAGTADTAASAGTTDTTASAGTTDTTDAAGTTASAGAADTTDAAVSAFTADSGVSSRASTAVSIRVAATAAANGRDAQHHYANQPNR
jgi:hypothetical protein